MDFYKILENIMLEKNLKISDISKKTNIPDSTLRSIINRKNKTIALDVAFKISKGLNISLEELAGEENITSNIKSKNEILEEEIKVYINLSAQIKKFRKENNINQEELAKKLGKSKSVISNWEKGINKPDVDNIAELCKIFKITPNQLFDWKESNNNLLNEYFQKLNKMGKEKALERIAEMTHIPYYQIGLENTESEKIKSLILKEEPKQETEMVKIVARGKGITYEDKSKIDKIIENSEDLNLDDIDFL